LIAFLRLRYPAIHLLLHLLPLLSVVQLFS
jgi:hypothetical protein